MLPLDYSIQLWSDSETPLFLFYREVQTLTQEDRDINGWLHFLSRYDLTFRRACGMTKTIMDMKNPFCNSESERMRQHLEELQKENTELKRTNDELHSKMVEIEKKVNEMSATTAVPSVAPEASMPAETPTPAPVESVIIADTESDSAATMSIDQREEWVKELKIISDKLEEIRYKDQIIKDIHNELQSYKTGLRQEIVKPILKSVILVYDVLAGMDATQSKEIQNAIYAVEDLLFEYDVEPMKVKVGDTFEPKTHNAVAKEETDNISLDRTIAKVTKTGFINTNTGHILRNPTVVVYVKK